MSSKIDPVMEAEQAIQRVLQAPSAPLQEMTIRESRRLMLFVKAFIAKYEPSTDLYADGVLHMTIDELVIQGFGLFGDENFVEFDNLAEVLIELGFEPQSDECDGKLNFFYCFKPRETV